MHVKKVLGLLGVAVLLTVGAFAVPALAATPECKVTAVPSVHKQDNGHHGYWADLTMTRTATLCAVETKGEGDLLHTRYTASVEDHGSLVTKAGALSPRLGTAMGAPRVGTVNGGWDQTFTAVGVAWTGYVGALPAETVATGGWVAAVYGGTIFIQPGMPYSWTYNTCAEQWIDASTNNDGQDASAGDINVLCVCPPVTQPPVATTPPAATTPPPPPATTNPPVTTAPATTTSSPATTTSSAAPPVTTTTSDIEVIPIANPSDSLPVTGSSLPIFLSLGSILVLLGGGILVALWFRRRSEVAGL